MPGERAGLKRGDVLLSVGGEKAVSRPQTIAIIKKNGPVPIEMVVERNGEEVRMTVVPEGAPGSSVIGFEFFVLEEQGS